MLHPTTTYPCTSQPALPLPAGILSALSCRCLDALTDQLGPEGAAALADLQQLWSLAEGYGYKDWLVFDASVVRGLAYYTGEHNSVIHTLHNAKSLWLWGA